jgi:hypothetical protein
MTLSLLVIALVATGLFSVVFLPVFAEAWRQEEECWKRRQKRLVGGSAAML